MAVTRPIQRVRASAPPPSQAVQAGARLGRYELLVPLAGGGMADVWVAEASGELGFRKRVAIKLLKPSLAAKASFRRMFLDEARLASRIHHANVVDVLDLGEDASVVYQVMPLVQGGSLARIVARANDHSARAGFGPGVALSINVDMLRGLQAAHDLCDEDGVRLGLLHRDVSPQNVLVGLDGVAKLADFGIAKAFGRVTHETEAGQLKGKLGYMAPEQLEGDAPTVRSDLFAAGVVLWESLTGCLLFPNEDVDDPVAARLRAEVPDPREVDPEIPAPLAETAMRALARRPQDRFESATEMAELLEAATRRATHQEVARVVERTVGADVKALDESIRRTRKFSESAPPPAPVEAAPTETSVELLRPSAAPAAPAPRARIALGLGLLAAVGIAGAGVAQISRAGSTTAGTSITAPPSTAPAKTEAPPPAVVSATAAVTPEPSASASADVPVIVPTNAPPRQPTRPPSRASAAASSSSPVLPSATSTTVTLPPRVDATSRQ